LLLSPERVPGWMALEDSSADSGRASLEVEYQPPQR